MPVPNPPFLGSRVLTDITLDEVFHHLNENVLFRGQWQVRQRDMPVDQYEALLDEKIRPALVELKQRCRDQKLLIPKAVYGYFPCQSQGNDLIVYHVDRQTEWVRFHFPRQEHGRHLCISDFFSSVDEGRMDLLPVQIVTVGQVASDYSQELFKSNKYTDYLYFHGLSVESAEAISEVVHKRVRSELGFASEDAAQMKVMLNQGYRGTRYSFGYPACPNLEDQAKLFQLLDPGRIGITLSGEFQLVPEQSTSALVVVHTEAKYFNIIAGAGADDQERE